MIYYTAVAASVAAFARVGYADVYMHNPRGSNDRNCERNVNRNNGNRLFDSQNNAAGGYACPRGVGNDNFQDEAGQKTFSVPGLGTWKQNKRMYYYEGSILPIEWTNQHGCGLNSNVQCDVILQYACEDTLDPQIDDFWPWAQNKAQAGTAYRGKQHFRFTDANDATKTHIGAPRDGIPRDSDDAATDTIPDNEESAIASSVETRRFGMHENYDYYQMCQRTERNKGLYTADQQVRRNDRRGTRQNPNGNRNGLECPEERDYYPWWAPSPWIDIAVLSDQADDNELCTLNSKSCSTRCAYYMSNTMNFFTKGYCDANHTTSTVSAKLNSQKWNQNSWYNNRPACEEAGFAWYEVSHSDNIKLDFDDFVCAKTHYARSNQLGNAMGDVISETNTTGVLADHVVHGVNANRFIWQIPTVPTAKRNDYFTAGMESAYKSCTLRMRYNISTGDFQQYPADANAPDTPTMVDSRNNSKTADDINTPLLQDPYIYIAENETDLFLSLAVNTNQYGRTFQDRSYVFSIKPLPQNDIAYSDMYDVFGLDMDYVRANLAMGGRIYNVNVRGKRGNIVQTYPSVEYDFVPNALKLTTYDMVHFQWTGSDYNPRRGCNNGEGGPPDPNDYVSSANANQNSRADRSNVVLQDSMSHNVPTDYLGYDISLDSDATPEERKLQMDTVLASAPCYNEATDAGNPSLRQTCYDLMIRLAHLNQEHDYGARLLRNDLPCLTQAEIDAIYDQENTAQNHPLNCAKLNAKPWPYFDAGILFLRKNGWFPFFSSRNNNFSNRDQKGVLCVGPDCPTNSVAGVEILQQPASYLSGTSVTRMTKTVCDDTLNNGDGANSNGAQSCISVETNSTIQGETFNVQEGDNDNKGDGNKKGCEVLTHSLLLGTSTVEQQVALAIILLFVGLFVAWLSYYLYNRWKASHEPEGKFRENKSWLGDGGILMSVMPFKKVPQENIV